MFYLYEPKTNVTTPITYDELAGITGMKKSNLASHKSKGQMIRKIGCYFIDDKTKVKQRKEWYSKVTYPDEHWKIIQGSDNQFKISNYGRVKRIYKSGKENFILPFQRKGKGNLYVKARWKGKYGEHKVSHIVAAHYLREPGPNERIVRKNGIVTDDYAGNLEIVSLKELGKRTGFKANSREVVQIDPNTGEVVNEFRSAREAGRKCFLSYQAVMNSCNGVTKWNSSGYLFRWADEYEEIAR